MTVCIAARAGQYIVGASDRMLTSGDVQFEPSAAAKTMGVSNCIFCHDCRRFWPSGANNDFVLSDVRSRIDTDKTNWWLVRDVADLYIKHYSDISNKRAEDAIFCRYISTSNSFIANQGTMNDRLVNDTARELLNFRMPPLSAIFAGHDPNGPHIYVVSENLDTNSLEFNCLDAVGFVAIGSGGRHYRPSLCLHVMPGILQWLTPFF